MKFLLSLPLLLILPTGEARASEGSLGIGVSGGVVITDSLEVLDTTWLVVPRLAWWHNPTLAIELEAGFSQGRTSIGVPETFAYTAITPRLGITGRMFDQKPVNLLLSAGAGAHVKNIADDGALGLPQGEKADIDFLANAGPGLMLPIGHTGLALRTDVRYVLSLGTENYQNRGDVFLNWEWTAGVTFGVPTRADADRDGILDADDRCPNEPEDKDGFEDSDGCPDPDNDGDGVPDVHDECAGEPEDKDGFDDGDGCPDNDNDEDGISDADDACPDDGGPAETGGCPDADGDAVADLDDECENEAGSEEAFGCPDADGDRVPDYRDTCADQAVEGVNPLLSDGCPGPVRVAESELLVDGTIEFARNRATLQRTSHAVLEELAAALKKYAAVKKIGIVALPEGDSEAARQLAQERAEAIKSWLVENAGIAATRLEVRPAAEGDVANGARRVEFPIVEQDELEPPKRR